MRPSSTWPLTSPPDHVDRARDHGFHGHDSPEGLASVVPLASETMLVPVRSVVARHTSSRGSRRSIERRSIGRRVRSLGLGFFFLSIGVNAGLGLYAVLAWDFGETQEKILGTSLCVTGAVVLALACEPAWERKLLRPIPTLGAVLGAVGFALAIAGIWTEAGSETWGKTMGTTFTLAVACAVASLLALARLGPGHGWIFTVTLALLGVGAAMISLVWWLGDDPADAYLRALGVVMIALAAFAVTVPVLHWVDRGALAAGEALIGAVRFCPYCGRDLDGASDGEFRCMQCGRGFTIAATEIEANPAHQPPLWGA